MQRTRTDAPHNSFLVSSSVPEHPTNLDYHTCYGRTKHTVLAQAINARGGCLDIFSLLYHSFFIFSLSPCLSGNHI